MGDRSAFDSQRHYFKRIGRLVCGIAAAVGFMTAVPAVASAQPVEVTPNPGLAVKCGEKVILVLDESASISAPDVARTREAANAFIHGLKDTGTTLGIVGFAVNARNIVTYQEVTTASEPTFTNAINNNFVAGLPAAQRNGTNWQGAFNLIAEDDATQRADLVVFITDGNPNIPATTVGDTATQWNQAIGPAITAANAVKDQGSHIFAMGVGAAVSDPASQARLQWISGPNEFPDHPFGASDYTLVSDFAGLRATLSAIVARLCGSSLVITKWVSDVHGGPWKEEPGWKFTATLDTPHTWLEPADAGTDHSATVTTNDEGVAEFHWRLPEADSTATLGATHETEKPGLHFVLATCQIHQLVDGELVETEHPPGGTTTGIPGAVLGREEFMTCDVYNSPEKPGGGGGGEEGETPAPPVHEPHLVVHKEMPARAQVGEHVPITITVHNHGTGPAHGVTLHETPPHGGQIIHVADGGSIEANGAVVWHIGTLRPGETRTVHATMLVTRTGMLLNTAVEDATDGDPAVYDAPVRVRPAPTLPTFTG